MILALRTYMKKAVLGIILLLLGWSCKAQKHEDNEQEIRKEVNTELNNNLLLCDEGITAIADFNGKTEYWEICNLENESRIIKIESYKGDVYYQELYFEKNGDLIYAKETENYIPKNHFTQMTWNCEFYIEKGKLITLLSFGHGKTENEEWNPELIFDMYKTRLNELNRLKK